MDPVREPLAVLLLPCRLEEFERAGHARDLLAIPRVVALEPSRRRTPRFLRDAAPMRSAKRLRFPGEPRVIVLYHAEQYQLARALRGRYEGAELWYMRTVPAVLRGDEGHSRDELRELDELAFQRATETHLVAEDADARIVNEPLRVRLRELGIISTRPFVPGARVVTR
jgi:hypothetical protein